MRLFKTLIIAGLSCLFTASLAQGYATSIAPATECGQEGQDPCDIGQIVYVQATFDTEGASDIALVSVGVLFNTSELRYIRAASTSPTYGLFVSVGRGFNIIQPGTQNLNLRVTTSNQINLDWLSSDTPDGTLGVGTWDMGIAALQVVGDTEGFAALALCNDCPGNTLFLGDGTFPPNNIGPDVVFEVPEPQLAVLSVAALLTLASVRRRARNQ